MSITVKSFLWCFGIATFFGFMTDAWAPCLLVAVFSWWISATLGTSIEKDRAKHKQELEAEKARTRWAEMDRERAERRAEEEKKAGINEEKADNKQDNKKEAIFSCPKCGQKHRSHEKRTGPIRCKKCGHKFIVSTEGDIPSVQEIPDIEPKSPIKANQNTDSTTNKGEEDIDQVSETDPDDSELEFYAQASMEAHNKIRRDEGVWGKAYADTDGVDEKARPLYIKLRVPQLKRHREEAERKAEAEREAQDKWGAPLDFPPELGKPTPPRGRK